MTEEGVPANHNEQVTKELNLNLADIKYTPTT